MNARPANIKACLLVVSALILSACATVPVTGRSQLNIVPDYKILAMSYKAYDDFLTKHKLCDDPSRVEMVKRVGNRIASAVEQFMYETGQSQRLRGYDWEFNLICDKHMNAWCMPGGKVVVYSGILPVTRDETGLAVVLGHEIAHAVSNHGAERISQEILYQLGGEALSILTGAYDPVTRRLLLQVYGLGTGLGILLPYSRIQEYEADHLGLIFMALAGYDPRAAVDFWQRMMAAGRNKPHPPEFLSTHPSDADRLARIKSLLPEAMSFYARGRLRKERRGDQWENRPRSLP